MSDSSLTAHPPMQAQTIHSFASFASLDSSDYWNEVRTFLLSLSEEIQFCCKGSTEDSSDHAKSPSDLSYVSLTTKLPFAHIFIPLLCRLLHSEEGLRRFQAGQLPETDQEWHRLVPQEAQDALGKKEVQRQSSIFEIVKSEREYVADLEAVEQVIVFCYYLLQAHESLMHYVTPTPGLC